jgi:hypothetical protein
MISLYLESIKKEVDHWKSLGLPQKKITERIRTRFKKGLISGQTTNWNLVAKTILTNERSK